MKPLTNPDSTLKRKYIRSLATRAINIEANILKDSIDRKPNPNIKDGWSGSQQWAFIRGIEYLLHFLENHKEYPMYDPDEVYPSDEFKTKFASYVSQAKLVSSKEKLSTQPTRLDNNK